MKLEQNIFFNAHHSPVGAFSTFTFGYPGQKGGFGCELGKPADQHLYIGCESAATPGVFEALPFFGQGNNAESDFVVEEQGDSLPKAPLRQMEAAKIKRKFTACVDQWAHEDFTFSVYSPTWSIPNPETATEAELKRILIPAVFGEITLDNRNGQHERRVFFGFLPNNEKDHIRENGALEDHGITSLCVGREYGVATAFNGAKTGIHFAIETLLAERNRDRFHFGNGTAGMLDWIVPAGEMVTVPLVFAFHRAGIATTGIEGCYFYNRYFPDLDSALCYGLEQFETYKSAAFELDHKWHRASLNEAQRFHIAQSIRSYYGSTQLLEHDGEPMWIVNEGEYRMINTLDLTVDQLFFEMIQNPWTTRNVLDHFLKFYSYHDQVFEQGRQYASHPGGLSFCHDMGVCNCFTKYGNSCYEIPGLRGCFSYMTHEELVNWLSCALVYVEQAKDHEWAKRNLTVFESLLESLVNRDHFDPTRRNGIMGLDSSRTSGGSEITTYDSLDPSLGQSRGNLYLGVKTWSVYLGLERIFQKLGKAECAEMCRNQADLAAKTISGAVGADGILPASIEPDSKATIIPVVEGLVFLKFNGRADVLGASSPFSGMVDLMRNHLRAVLQPGKCLFPDGSWRLTTGNTNSWLSKIYLCQYIARSLLGLELEALTEDTDKAHEAWLKSPENAYWAWGDQFYAGIVKGSRYYPRGVTSVLWLDEPS